MFQECLHTLRRRNPLIHSITNYVTVNDCANILLASGASPIMADDPLEAAEITAGCSGLNLNMGTLSPSRVSAMLQAGKKANALGHPVVLDPVGVGASSFRRETARTLLHNLRFTAIRGNLSEILTLARGRGQCRGVDAADGIHRENLPEISRFAMGFSEEIGAIVIISGEIDLAADARQAFCIYNGSPMMRRVTGTGCQLSALTAAFLAANPQSPLEASAAAVCTMGVAGELAARRLGDLDGTMTYRNYIIDAVSRLDGAELEEMADYRILRREE